MKYKLLIYGKRSFSVAAADLWNSLHVPLITNVNSSYFKYNVLLLIRKNVFYYFQLIYVCVYILLFLYFVYTIEKL